MSAVQVASKAGERPLRIVHLAMMRALSGGQRKQLMQERRAATELERVVWDTIAVHDGASILELEVRTPKFMRWPVLRSVYAWKVALELSRKYDFILVRHAPFDIVGVLIAGAMRNRVSVHHSKEIEELPLIRPGILGWLLSRLEQIVGKYLIRKSVALLGVTQEIAEYEVQRGGSANMPHEIFPNAVVTDEIPLASDNRELEVINSAFLCGRFNAWHGLDLLVADAGKVRGKLDGKLRIHLIGALSKSQLDAVAPYPELFIIHGYQNESAYRNILARCDVSIGSLALRRQGLTQGSTLKMCETLALGVPVYAGSEDVVLPSTFRFCFVDRNPSLSQLYAFGKAMKFIPRSTIRAASVPFVEKRYWLERTVTFLQALQSGLDIRTDKV